MPFEPNTLLAVVAAVVSAVGAKERRRRMNRRRDKLTRRSILLPHRAPFTRIFLAQEDSAFITFFGLDVAAFMALLIPFTAELANWRYVERQGVVRRLSNRGRRRNLLPHAVMGCALMWLRSKCEQRHLCLHLGETPSSVSRTIHIAISVLYHVLETDPLTQIRFPTPEECDSFRSAVRMRYPILDGMVGMIDGLKLRVHAPTDVFWQNAMYNGWKSDTFVSCVIAFTPDGCICTRVLNCPGSWNDVKVARLGGLFESLAKAPDGCWFAGDSIFPVEMPQIRRPAKVGEIQPATPLEVAFERDLVSVRQGAEWGMNAFQRTWPRTTAVIEWETLGLRRKMLEVCCLLLNYRTRRVGLSQIRTVWSPWLDSSWEGWRG